ncbi:PREDICTED: 60 kDa SS-A/Ro ribonucleoprotein-like [Dinoponera quadriceps]|uniref:60 kDa SS-A/Ro ribonucleoprotein-like n=1 Tax=Dinoponera quadriceps TaxID=609295 RepID=A0A6P3Y325_DINQU|nr:PREDICTED: 60 kDa SS-A/Ro ribonucleoprotein-like [Dinoponera quadriceps]
MAAEDASNNFVRDPEVRLSQFLYVGKEYADYHPGNWFVHDYFRAVNIMSILELAENPKKQLIPIELITKAFDSGLVPCPETLVFALAVCCRQIQSEKLRHEAYKSVGKICASQQHFMLFVKFASKLSKQKELAADDSAKSGWGTGLRKAVNQWYLSKEPLDLAKCVTRCRSRYGWKHKDIIKLSHPVANNPEMGIVLQYIIHGMQHTRASLEKEADNPKINEIMEYIQNVEDFKHCEDEIRAAALLETHDLSLDHVPGHLLTSKEVWKALISSMDIVTLLNNLQRIHNLEILKPDAPTVAIITEKLVNEERLARDKVHPALILITIRNYENSGKPLSYEKRKVKEQAKKPPPPPPKPNSRIIDALYKALNLSFFHLQPTGLRYMVTIDMNKVMLDSRAWRNANMTGAEAGCMIALSLIRCEKNVTVATFKNVGVHTVNIDKTASFGQTMRRLSQMPVGNVNLAKPMSWAAHQNNKYDVFINIVDQVHAKTDTSEEALVAYRTKLKLPHTKLINCAVCSSSTYYKANPDKNILTINGFDATVPTVIRAFAKSLF